MNVSKLGEKSSLLVYASLVYAINIWSEKSYENKQIKLKKIMKRNKLGEKSWK